MKNDRYKNCFPPQNKHIFHWKHVSVFFRYVSLIFLLSLFSILHSFFFRFINVPLLLQSNQNVVTLHPKKSICRLHGLKKAPPVTWQWLIFVAHWSVTFWQFKTILHSALQSSVGSWTGLFTCASTFTCKCFEWCLTGYFCCKLNGSCLPMTNLLKKNKCRSTQFITYT